MADGMKFLQKAQIIPFARFVAQFHTVQLEIADVVLLIQVAKSLHIPFPVGKVSGGVWGEPQSHGDAF